MSPKLLLEELFFKQEQVPKWNKTLEECRIIQPVDQFTDISYQVDIIQDQLLHNATH